MKTSGFIVVFTLLLTLSLLLAPRVQAIVMIKNYARHTSAFSEPAEYLKTKNEKTEDAPRYTGWKAILNLFR